VINVEKCLNIKQLNKMPTNNIKRLESDLEQGKVMKCPNCKKVVSISNCKWAERILTLLKTVREINENLSITLMNTRMSKNGTIQRLHKLVGQLLDLMDEDQRKKAKKINQVMRDEIKKWEKETKLK